MYTYHATNQSEMLVECNFKKVQNKTKKETNKNNSSLFLNDKMCRFYQRFWIYVKHYPGSIPFSNDTIHMQTENTHFSKCPYPIDRE